MRGAARALRRALERIDAARGEILLAAIERTNTRFSTHRRSASAPYARAAASSRKRCCASAGRSLHSAEFAGRRRSLFVSARCRSAAMRADTRMQA